MIKNTFKIQKTLDRSNKYSSLAVILVTLIIIIFCIHNPIFALNQKKHGDLLPSASASAHTTVIIFAPGTRGNISKDNIMDSGNIEINITQGSVIPPSIIPKVKPDPEWQFAGWQVSEINIPKNLNLKSTKETINNPVPDIFDGLLENIKPGMIYTSSDLPFLKLKNTTDKGYLFLATYQHMSHESNLDYNPASTVLNIPDFPVPATGEHKLSEWIIMGQIFFLIGLATIFILFCRIYFIIVYNPMKFTL